MRSRVRAVALLAASVLLAASLSGCVSALPALPQARQNERLDAALHMDSSGTGRLRGRLGSWTASEDGGKWSGTLVVAVPAFVEGVSAEVLVPARVDASTAVGDGSGARGPAALASLIQRLSGDGSTLDVTCRKEGGMLRALRVGYVGSPGWEPPRIDGVLELDASGTGKYRGPVSRIEDDVSHGLLWIVPRYRTQGIEVTVSVPLEWDAATRLAASGATSTVAAALRTGSDPFSGHAFDIVFRRGPDRIIVESARER